jgi:hypothetical protein
MLERDGLMKKPIELTLRELVEEGILEEEWDEKAQEFKYKVTEKGVRQFRKKIKLSPIWVINYFYVFYKFNEGKKDFWAIFREFAAHMISEFRINFIPIFLYSVEKGWIGGFEITGPLKRECKELVKLNQKELMRLAKL